MRRLPLIALILSLILLTACWDYQEPDQLATVYAMGIDRIPGSKPILVTVQILTPQGKSAGKEQGEGEKSFYVMSSQGKSLLDAIANLSKQSPRRVYLAHNKIILLGQELVANGIDEVLDDLDRNRELRRTNWVLVGDGQAKELLGKGMDAEKVPGKGMEEILREFRDLNFTVPVNRKELFVQLEGETGVAILPVLQWRTESNTDSGSGNILTIAKTAILTGKNLKGVLSEEESADLMWLLDKVKGGSMALSYSPGSGQKGEITLDIISGKTTLQPQVSKHGIKMKISCAGKVSVQGSESTALDLNNPETIKELEKYVSDLVKLRIEKSIVTAQKKVKADYIGFGAKVHDSYPSEWKSIQSQWNEIFPTIQYEVSCDIKVRGFGVIRDPVKRVKEKEE